MEKHVKTKEKFIWVGFEFNAFGSNADKLNTHGDIMEFNIPYGSILFFVLDILFILRMHSCWLYIFYKGQLQKL